MSVSTQHLLDFIIQSAAQNEWAKRDFKINLFVKWTELVRYKFIKSVFH